MKKIILALSIILASESSFANSNAQNLACHLLSRDSIENKIEHKNSEITQDAFNKSKVAVCSNLEALSENDYSNILFTLAELHSASNNNSENKEIEKLYLAILKESRN